MEKIDWKNLSYDDFTGFVAVYSLFVVCPVFRRALVCDL